MLYFVFLVINFLIAVENNVERLRRISAGDPTQINHAAWFAVYVIMCLPVIWVESWTYAVAVFLQHGFAFPVMYNILALGRSDAFHLSTTTTAKYDRTIVRIIDWLNRRFNGHLPYSMFVPDLIICVGSIVFLWI
jgi:hypothetical protein